MKGPVLRSKRRAFCFGESDCSGHVRFRPIADFNEPVECSRMRVVLFLSAAAALIGCAAQTEPHSILYRDARYRLLTGDALQRTVVGSTFEHPASKVVRAGGNWERFDAGGVYVRPADRIVIFRSSYFFRADRLCVQFGGAARCRRLYVNKRGQYVSEAPLDDVSTLPRFSPVDVKHRRP